MELAYISIISNYQDITFYKSNDYRKRVDTSFLWTYKAFIFT